MARPAFRVDDAMVPGLARAVLGTLAADWWLILDEPAYLDAFSSVLWDSGNLSAIDIAYSMSDVVELVGGDHERGWIVLGLLMTVLMNDSDPLNEFVQPIDAVAIREQFYFLESLRDVVDGKDNAAFCRHVQQHYWAIVERELKRRP
jgi:hypothetical protein